MVEHPRGDVLLLGVELGHRPLEVLLDDVPRAAEPLERLEPQPPEPAARSSSQSRCITSWRYGASIRAPPCAVLDAAEAADAGSICPVPTSSDPVDERRFDVDRLARELREALDGRRIAARAASRSRRSRRRVFAKRSGSAA